MTLRPRQALELEMHVFLQRREERRWCKQHGVPLIAYGVLGGRSASSPRPAAASVVFRWRGHSITLCQQTCSVVCARLCAHVRMLTCLSCVPAGLCAGT